MNIYYNDILISSCKEDLNSALDIIKKYLKKKNIKNDDYFRWVELDNGRTMVDFGSWSNFFYVDCPHEVLFPHDKTRTLPTNKGTQS